MDVNNDKRVPSKTYLKNDISKFSIAFDIPEQQKSNSLICGGNSTGKSRLACGIASILQNLNWRIIAFDPVGNYQKISDIPIFYRVRKARNYDEESKEWYYPYPVSSMIFDTSLLIPDLQKSFVNEESKTKRCQYCNKPISKQEYERERHGYCDECSDDLATEEEDYGDKEEESTWGI